MRLGLGKGAMVLAFAAGAVMVHCGTTDFASGGDAGSDGGGGTGKKDGSGPGGAKDSGASKDSGSSKDAGVSHDSGGSPDTGPPACLLSKDCKEKAAPYCCYSVTDKATSCGTDPCESGTYKTCATPGDCSFNVGGGYCCVGSATSTYGLCEPPAVCASVSGAEIRCTANIDCPSGEKCSGVTDGVCVPAPDGGMGKDGGSGSSDGGTGTGDAVACIPEMICGSMCCSGAERCIAGTSDYCGTTVTCGATATKVTCCPTAPGMIAACTSSAGIGDCTSGTPCTCSGETCTIPVAQPH